MPVHCEIDLKYEIPIFMVNQCYNLSENNFFKIILHQIVEKNKGFVLQLVKRVLSILYFVPSFNLFIWKAIYSIKQSIIMIIHSLTI